MFAGLAARGLVLPTRLCLLGFVNMQPGHSMQRHVSCNVRASPIGRGLDHIHSGLQAGNEINDGTTRFLYLDDFKASTSSIPDKVLTRVVSDA